VLSKRSEEENVKENYGKNDTSVRRIKRLLKANDRQCFPSWITSFLIYAATTSQGKKVRRATDGSKKTER